jgi:hypothetical protein
MKTIRKIDELNEKGDDKSREKAELLKGVLNNRNPSSAEEFSRFIDEIEIKDEDKEDIKSGKKSPHSYVTKERDTGSEYKVCKSCNKKLPASDFYDGRCICKNCKNSKNNQQQRERRYMTTASGEVLTIDKSKLEGIDFDAIEASIKSEKASEVVLNPDADCMEFKVVVNNFIWQNSKYFDNQEIFNQMKTETKNDFLEAINKMEDMIINLKNKLKETFKNE